MPEYIAVDQHGRAIALLEARDRLDAELYVLRGNVRGAHHIVDAADIEKLQQRLAEALRQVDPTLSEAAARSGARGRGDDLPRISVPRQEARPEFHKASAGSAQLIEIREPGGKIVQTGSRLRDIARRRGLTR